MGVARDSRRIASPTIVGIGVSVWDNILRVASLPQPGEVVQAIERVECVGGGITVAMATAANLGSSVALIDVLGDDSVSDNIIQCLRDADVDVSAIQRISGCTGSTASVWTESRDAERTIVFSPGTACNRLEWNEHLESLVRHAKWLHLNGRHPSACIQAIEVAKRVGCKVSFDGGAFRYRNEILPMLLKADIVIVAKHFAQEHFRAVHDAQNIPRGASELAAFLMTELRCDVVGVTDGSHGSSLVDHLGNVFEQPAINIGDAIDTTGCGDAYHGAFLHAYGEGRTLGEAALRAAEVASQTAKHLGGFGPHPPVNP